MLKNVTVVLLIFTLIACAQYHKPTSKLSAVQKLQQLIKQEQTFREQSNPFNRQEVGGANANLPDISPKSLANNYTKLDHIYQQLLAIDQQALTLSQQIDLAVLIYTVKNDIDSYLNKEHYIPLTSESGFHVWIATISKQVQMNTVADYKDYLSRLNKLPTYFDQQIAWMNKGIDTGITQPQVVLTGFEKSIIAFVKPTPEASSYYQPFTRFPKHFSATLQQKLQQQAKLAINKSVFPSYQKYYDFMTKRYQPLARKTIAASALPNGQHYYQNRVSHYTTLPTPITKIHQLGLQEVARIKQQMLAIIRQINFEGDFSDFVHFLRTDKQFYAETPSALLKEAAYLAKKMDGKLPQFFKKLPRTPYGIAPVPQNIAPKYTTGRYSPPSREDQAGSYWVNTYRLDRRPLYVLPALTLHEAVPGHHLQGSLAREMENVPAFRNNTYISAFGEGWGLYAEYLGIEAGMYETPYQNFGRLTYEMWRACRLVIDTGIHSQGWTRQQAINYLASNTALSLHNVTTEVDRYISWPAQALSYKMGEITIKHLRQEAEESLKDKFNLRIFHNKLLENGSMPLSSLEKVIYKYIAEVKEGKARKATTEKL
jgi:uncharacterized protein (DUF885 family)